MKLKLYLNREPIPETVKPGDVVANVQICPLGDWPHGETVQHVTKEAAEEMIANAASEILVDFDHDAEEGGSTKAAAWISNLRLDPERGLVGDFKFTDAGAESVTNRRFRFLSPCWEVAVEEWKTVEANGRKEKVPAEVTPTRLVSVALTKKDFGDRPQDQARNMMKTLGTEDFGDRPQGQARNVMESQQNTHLSHRHAGSVPTQFLFPHKGHLIIIALLAFFFSDYLNSFNIRSNPPPPRRMPVDDAVFRPLLNRLRIDLVYLNRLHVCCLDEFRV